MAMDSFLRLAKKSAMRSTEDYRIGACIVSSGRVLGVGVNQKNKMNSLVRIFFNNFPTMHAETNCMSYLDPEDIKGSILYVYRHRIGGGPGLAKPCMRCAILIQTVGIKRVVYSTDIAPFFAVWEVRRESIEHLAPAPRRFKASPLYLARQSIEAS